MKTVRNERKLLKVLIHKSNSGIDPIPEKKIPVNSNNYYLNRLIKKELITPVYTKSNPLSDDPDYYEITNKGKHFYEERNEEFSMLMLKSFWLPIAVAFVTSILTNGILDGIKALLK